MSFIIKYMLGILTLKIIKKDKVRVDIKIKPNAIAADVCLYLTSGIKSRRTTTAKNIRVKKIIMFSSPVWIFEWLWTCAF